MGVIGRGLISLIFRQMLRFVIQLFSIFGSFVMTPKSLYHHALSVMRRRRGWVLSLSLSVHTAPSHRFITETSYLVQICIHEPSRCIFFQVVAILVFSLSGYTAYIGHFLIGNMQVSLRVSILRGELIYRLDLHKSRISY